MTEPTDSAAPNDPEARLTIEINGQPITADMATWREAFEVYQQRRTADRLAWEQQQREAGQVWTAVYWRHHYEYRDEYFSAADAAGALFGGSESGELYAAGVVLPDGTMVEDYVSLLSYDPYEVTT